MLWCHSFTTVDCDKHTNYAVSGDTELGCRGSGIIQEEPQQPISRRGGVGRESSSAHANTRTCSRGKVLLSL